MDVKSFKRSQSEEKTEADRRAARAQNFRDLAAKWPGVNADRMIELNNAMDDLAFDFQMNEARKRYVAEMRQRGMPFKVIS